MRHNVFGRQLSRDTGQRLALLKGLAGALVRSESIETTEAKAKAASSLIERLITKAKKPNLSNVRELESVLTDRSLVEKLVHHIAPRFAQKAGGYLRLVKLGNRSGDNAPMVRIELTEKAAAHIEPKASKDQTPVEQKIEKPAKVTSNKKVISAKKPTKPKTKKTTQK